MGNTLLHQVPSQIWCQELALYKTWGSSRWNFCQSLSFLCTPQRTISEFCTLKVLWMADTCLRLRSNFLTPPPSLSSTSLTVDWNWTKPTRLWLKSSAPLRWKEESSCRVPWLSRLLEAKRQQRWPVSKTGLFSSLRQALAQCNTWPGKNMLK